MSTLFFDPDCGLCQHAAVLLTHCALTVEIEPGWQEELIIAGVDFNRFAHAIPLVLDNKQVAYGVVAIALALKTSRRRAVRWAGAVLLAPGTRRIAEKIYALIAENRWRLPGSTCRIT